MSQEPDEIGGRALWGDWRLLRVKGNSMAPTLRSGQTVQTRPVTGLAANNPRARGSIVALQHPFHSESIYLKRVVGLPNEHVAIANGRVEIDGYPLYEAYLGGRLETQSKGATQWFTGADEVFVLGDNRRDSEDSRVFGPVALNLIVGEAWFRYIPPTLLRTLRGTGNV